MTAPHPESPADAGIVLPVPPQVPRAVQCFVDHLRQSLAPGFPIG